MSQILDKILEEVDADIASEMRKISKYEGAPASKELQNPELTALVWQLMRDMRNLQKTIIESKRAKIYSDG
jgi:hypothetical protein